MCLLGRREAGKKSCVRETFSQNQGSSRPDIDTGRQLKIGVPPLKEGKEEEEGNNFHHRVKTPLFRLDLREVQPTLFSCGYCCSVVMAKSSLWLLCKMNEQSSDDSAPYTFGLILLETQGQLHGWLCGHTRLCTQKGPHAWFNPLLSLF